MGRTVLLLGSHLAIALTTVSCATLPIATTAQGDSILQATLGEPDQKTQEVSTAQLRQILADNIAVVLDARKRSEYAAGHIPGAVNVDATETGAVAAVDQVVAGDKGAALVLYCNGPFCQASRHLGERLVASGFTDVRRYQLGMPIWRALGGPTAIELEGIVRIFTIDRTAMFVDARSPQEFAQGSLRGAHNVPADQLASGVLDRAPLPRDDFNTRIVLFGRNAAQARARADALSKKPWHNVTYYPGRFDTLRTVIE